MANQKKSLRENVRKEPAARGGKTRKASARKGVKPTTRRKSYVLDLRVHSPASLGYLGIEGIDTAPALVRLAKVKGLDVIGVTDFYQADFIDRIAEAAKDSPLIVIPGVDIKCTVGACDDVTISCFFPEDVNSSGIQRFLDDLKIPTWAYGKRDYLVEQSFEVVLKTIEKHGGVALPSRIDKTPHRMTAIPLLVEEYGFRAFDVAYPEDTAVFFKERWPRIKFFLFSFSNASALAQVGSRIAKVKMPSPGYDGVKEIVGREVPS